MKLQQALLSWDGKSVSDIAAIYEGYSTNKNFTSYLIQLLTDGSSQKGASWLLKRFFESGGSLSDGQISQVYSQLHCLEHWETKLHILQVISYMPVPELQKEQVEVFIRECLISDHKFVKAWAYSGFYELARQYPELQQEVMEFMQLALKDEPASVKARVRKLLVKGF